MALRFPLLVQKSTQQIEIPIALGATVLLLLLGLTGVIEWWGGIVLLLGFIGYLTYLFFQTKNNPDDEEGEGAKDPNITLTLILSSVGGLVTLCGQFCNSIDSIYCLVSGLALFISFGGYSLYLFLKNKNKIHTSYSFFWHL